MRKQPLKTNRSSTANDVVLTPRSLSHRIINHFKPSGRCLDPCAGNNAFFDGLPEPKCRCEISEGTDFFAFTQQVDWIISNPPYSIYNEFLLHAFSVAQHVVFLIPLNKVFKNTRLERAIDRYGGLQEVLYLGSGRQHGFPFGFPVGCVHYAQNYRGQVTVTKWFPERENGSLF